ncbi:uncharacterized protein P884DRAFT_255340 [Thermothelomyces heterothallicus CBS 202.75]|uniref:uncharacterized protein n=1 Tax=Thermothelomyces heterothallicus CBS 202.75 TaxID=1149848 RepID=UPI003743C489
MTCLCWHGLGIMAPEFLTRVLCSAAARTQVLGNELKDERNIPPVSPLVIFSGCSWHGQRRVRHCIAPLLHRLICLSSVDLEMYR